MEGKNAPMERRKHNRAPDRGGIPLAGLLRKVLLVLVMGIGLFSITGTSNYLDSDEEVGDLDTSGYTGKTSQARITAANAENLTVGVYLKGLNGSAIGRIAAEGEALPPAEAPPAMSVASVARRLVDTVARLDLAAPTEAERASALISKDGTEYGNCGGSVSYDAEFADITGTFTGDIVFRDYCENGVTIAGDAIMVGDADVNGDELEVDISFTELLVRSAGESATVNGVLSATYDDPVITADIDMLTRDNRTGKLYWVENAFMSLVERDDHIEYDINGKYYDPEEGHVYFSTEIPFRVNNDDRWPSRGRQLSTGADGTKARLMVGSNEAYGVEADTDGNGSFEWQSGRKLWSDL
jgi:hypothetical protein